MHALQEFPADDWQLVRYATYTAEHVTSHGMVINYVLGVHSLQTLAGFWSPTLSSPNLKLVLDGIKAELAKPVNQATPMTLEILKEVALLVNYDNEFEHTVFAAMLTGFYLVVRSSNLVPTSTEQFNSHEQLTHWHVTLDKDLEFVLFLIEWSKNNQNYKRELWVPVKAAKDPSVCLVRVLNNYFA